MSAGSLNLHLSQLSELNFHHAWLQSQYLEAIEILLTNTAELSWVSKIPRKDLKSAAYTIDASPKTLAREIIDDWPVTLNISYRAVSLDA